MTTAQLGKEIAMFAKKSICTLSVGGLVLVAVPALAGPPHWAPAHGHRAQHARTVVTKHHYHPQVVRQVVVTRPVVRRTVVVHRAVPVARPVYYAPAPVYAAPVYAAPVYAAPFPLGTLGGAVIGAVIGHHAGHGPVPTAVGAAVGAVVGSHF
jgi:hypothetical protein